MNDNEKLLQELNKENPNDYPQGIWNEVASWWYNEVLDKKLKEERLKICNDCEFYNWSLRMCDECGCFMPFKSLIVKMKCPVGKW